MAATGKPPIPPLQDNPLFFVGHPLSTNFNWLEVLTGEVLRLSYWCLPGIVYSKIPITAFDSKKDYVGQGTGAAKRRFGYDVLHNACRDRCMVVANIWMTMRHLRIRLRSARGPAQTSPVPKARNAFRIELTAAQSHQMTQPPCFLDRSRL